MEEEKKKESEPISEDFSTFQKVVKTIFLVLCWVMIGLFTEITGPTQKDLIIITDTDYELVSRAISGRSVGYFIGALLGGPLVDKLGKYCDLMIALCLVGAAVATIVAPYTSSITLLWFFFMLDGTFEGVINIAGQKLLLDLWKEKATGPLHVLHFGFGMGSFIVPQIANPFLAVLAETNNTIYNINGSQTLAVSRSSLISTTTKIPSSSPKYLKESHIESAFLIVGIIVATLSIVFFIYQFCGRHISNQKKTNETNEKALRKVVKIIDPGTCTDGDRWFGVQVFVLLFLYFFNVVGGDRLYGKFIRSYAIDKHGFSGTDGSLINTEYWICFALGRFLGLFTGRLIPIRILIMIEAIGALTIAILLDIFARDNDLALWILTAPMGLFIGPLFPSGIGWGDFHVEFTGFAITFVLMGGALGGMSYLWVIGYLYEYHGYDMFLHQLVAYGAIVVIFTILLNIVGKRHGGRFENKTNDKDIELVKEIPIDVKLNSKDKEQGLAERTDFGQPPAYAELVESNTRKRLQATEADSNYTNTKL